nr:VOC family protein [Sulfobacillus harzensis]
MSIRFVTVPVANSDRARDWYQGKLGCTVVVDQQYGPVRWIEMAFPGGRSNVVLFTPPGFEHRVGQFTGISLMADDIEAVYEDMQARGVEFVEPLATADWGGKQAIFRDSEGNQFVLAQES